MNIENALKLPISAQNGEIIQLQLAKAPFVANVNSRKTMVMIDNGITDIL